MPFLVAILDAILNTFILILTACKNYTCISFASNLICLYDLIKMQTDIHFQISVFKSSADTLYLADILDAILNFLQGPMISRVHYIDSMTLSNTEEAQICVQYKYMVKHTKYYFGSHVGCHLCFVFNQKALIEDN